MKKMKSLLLLAGAAMALSVGIPQSHAQGNFDPEQMRQRRLERIKEDFGITKDDEWKIVSERVSAVMKAQEATMRGRIGGMFGGRGGGPGGGGGGRRGGGDNAGGGGGERRAGGGGGAGGFGGMFEQPQEVKDLQAAVEAKAPAEEIKAKLEKVRAARKAKEAELTKAQDKLKEVLDARQEASAVLAGLLQ
jgi:hypothetical protein